MATEYYILSKRFSSDNPAYALVDDANFPDQVICHTGDPGNKGHWKVIPGPNGSKACYIQLSDDNLGRQAVKQAGTDNVMVAKPGNLWMIIPPLNEGGPDTERRISTAVNPGDEWAIHGQPRRGIPDSLVRVIPMSSGKPPSEAVWYMRKVEE